MHGALFLHFRRSQSPPPPRRRTHRRTHRSRMHRSRTHRRTRRRMHRSRMHRSRTHRRTRRRMHRRMHRSRTAPLVHCAYIARTLLRPNVARTLLRPTIDRSIDRSIIPLRGRQGEGTHAGLLRSRALRLALARGDVMYNTVTVSYRIDEVTATHTPT